MRKPSVGVNGRRLGTDENRPKKDTALSQTQRLPPRVQQDDAAEIQHCDWLVGLQIS